MRSQPISAVFKPGDRVHLKGHAHTPATTGTVITETLTTAHVRWDDNDATTPHHPQHLEPAGEPMSTKQHFGNAYGTLKVRENRESGSIYITIDSQGSCAGVGIEEAPALALAILEAAGHDADIDDASSLVNSAMGRLAMHVSTEATKAKESADREALEVEALHLCRILWDNPDQAWTPMSPEAKAKWLKMARTARTLHGVTK